MSEVPLYTRSGVDSCHSFQLHLGPKAVRKRSLGGIQYLSSEYGGVWMLWQTPNLYQEKLETALCKTVALIRHSVHSQAPRPEPRDPTPVYQSRGSRRSENLTLEDQHTSPMRATGVPRS